MYLSGVLGRGRALAHPPPTEPERARGLVARSQGSSTGPLPAQEPLQPGSRVANTASSSSLRLPGSILRTTSDPTLERRRRRASGPPTSELSGPEQAALNRADSSPSQRLGFARTSSAPVSSAQRPDVPGTVEQPEDDDTRGWDVDMLCSISSHLPAVCRI